ncbi:MAG TPA: 30S ribosomal protein S8 [Polyangia bacterium]|jgi:small subunit ribosomal protein S8
MSMTDPIADMLTRIRNAIISRKTKVEMPSSKLKVRLAELLRNEGYISTFTVNEEKRGSSLLVELRYDRENRNAIIGLRRVSKPGQRRYVKTDDIPRVRSGLGVAVLSTSKGIMTDREARKQGLGGELMCEVW